MTINIKSWTSDRHIWTHFHYLLVGAACIFLSQLLVPEEFASRGSENSRKLLTLKVKNRVRVLGSGQDRPLSEPIRLQHLEGSARSQAWKKIKSYTSLERTKIKFSEKKYFGLQKPIIFREKN